MDGICAEAIPFSSGVCYERGCKDKSGGDEVMIAQALAGRFWDSSSEKIARCFLDWSLVRRQNKERAKKTTALIDK